MQFPSQSIWQVLGLSFFECRCGHCDVDLRIMAVEIDWERIKFGAAYCVAIIQELGSVDWHGIFFRKSVDQCTDLFYDRVLVVLHLVTLCPKVSVGHEGAKWFEEQGNKSCREDEKNERRCMIDDDIDDCDCERLRADFTGRAGLR
jgi:hypothetical protein